MCNNGSNECGVPYPCIRNFEKLLNGHSRVRSFSRSNDILFHLVLKNESKIDVLLVNDYTISESAVYEYHSAFPSAEYIVTGSYWNMYTKAAKECGNRMNIGIFNLSEFAGALNWEDPKKYYRKDSEGNPQYEIRQYK